MLLIRNPDSLHLSLFTQKCVMCSSLENQWYRSLCTVLSIPDNPEHNDVKY